MYLRTVLMMSVNQRMRFGIDITSGGAFTYVVVLPSGSEIGQAQAQMRVSLLSS